MKAVELHSLCIVRNKRIDLIKNKDMNKMYRVRISLDSHKKESILRYYVPVECTTGDRLKIYESAVEG